MCVIILLTAGKKCNGIIFINFGAVRERIEVSCVKSKKKTKYLVQFQKNGLEMDIRTFSLLPFFTSDSRNVSSSSS